MANRHVIARMQSLLDDYQAGVIRPEEVERSIEMHIGALEGIQLKQVHQGRQLSYRLVRAHVYSGNEELIGSERIPMVIAEFRLFLTSLGSGA
jgi:hypothetical protein